MPSVDLPKGQTATSQLAQLATEGLARRIPNAGLHLPGTLGLRTRRHRPNRLWRVPAACARDFRVRPRPGHVDRATGFGERQPGRLRHRHVGHRSDRARHHLRALPHHRPQGLHARRGHGLPQRPPRRSHRIHDPPLRRRPRRPDRHLRHPGGARGGSRCGPRPRYGVRPDRPPGQADPRQPGRPLHHWTLAGRGRRAKEHVPGRRRRPPAARLGPTHRRCRAPCLHPRRRTGGVERSATGTRAAHALGRRPAGRTVHLSDHREDWPAATGRAGAVQLPNDPARPAAGGAGHGPPTHALRRFPLDDDARPLRCCGAAARSASSRWRAPG